jgi:hypothetical protein
VGGFLDILRDNGELSGKALEKSILAIAMKIINAQWQ